MRGIIRREDRHIPGMDTQECFTEQEQINTTENLSDSRGLIEVIGAQQGKTTSDFRSKQKPRNKVSDQVRGFNFGF